MRQQFMMSLALGAIAASCDRGGDQQATKASALSGTANSAILTFDSIPRSAREALSAQAPDFIPWLSDTYPRSVRDSVRPTSDEGLSVVRGRFRSPTVMDYVIAGYDRRQNTLRIMALLADTNGVYKTIEVSNGPQSSDSAARRPLRYLKVDPQERGIADFLAIPNDGGPPILTERWRWFPDRKQFLLVVPG